jgi:hypothetical protein
LLHFRDVCHSTETARRQASISAIRSIGLAVPRPPYIWRVSLCQQAFCRIVKRLFTQVIGRPKVLNCLQLSLTIARI